MIEAVHRSQCPKTRLLGYLGVLLVLVPLFCPFTAAGEGTPSMLPPTWQAVEDEDLRFRVSLPPDPVRSTSSRRTIIGQVSEFKVEAHYDSAEFLVQIRELPPAARWFTTDSYLFSEVKDGFLMGGLRPKLVERPIIRGGHAGWLLRYGDPEREDGDWVEDAEIFLVESRLYFAVVARRRSFEDDSLIEAFFQSFDIR